MATVFTKIIQGAIPSYKVAEDDRFYAFLDINPLTAGHTLVVPKFAEGQELDYIFDMDARALGAMMAFSQRVAVRLREVTGCARVAVVVLGLEVPHVHIHLVPIDSEGDVDFRKPRVKMSPEEMDALAAKLAI